MDAPYGFRRAWQVPPLPNVGTGSEHWPKRERLVKRGPELKPTPVAPARVTEQPPELERAIRHWGPEKGSNWDAYPASILLSVSPNAVRGARDESGLGYSSHAGAVYGPRTAALGVDFTIWGCVTTSSLAGLHIAQRRQLAAALRDAADLLEGTP